MSARALQRSVSLLRSWNAQAHQLVATRCCSGKADGAGKDGATPAAPKVEAKPPTPAAPAAPSEPTYGAADMYTYNPMSFYHMELEIVPQRCPAPSNKA